MGIICSHHFWQIGSITSLATETTGREILVAFWPKHGLRSDLRVPNLKMFHGGACPQTPLAYSHLSTCNGHTSLKAGSGHAHRSQLLYMAIPRHHHRLGRRLMYYCCLHLSCVGAKNTVQSLWESSVGIFGMLKKCCFHLWMHGMCCRVARH